MALLEKELKSAAAALVEARRLVDMPAGRHRLVYAPNPIYTLLHDQQETRGVVNLLRYDALHLAQKGDMKEALRSCQAILNAARSLDDEPILISQLIRIACVTVACGAVERTLALGEARAEDLARLQRCFAEEEKHPSMVIGLRGERATSHIIFTGVANGTLSVKELVFGEAEWGLQEVYLRWTMKGKARYEHPEMLRWMNRAIDVARLPAHEQAAVEKELDHELRASRVEGSLMSLLLPAIFKVSEAHRRKLAFVRCIQATLAVERYSRDKGTWPASLEKLKPDFLGVVPLDPFDGKPLRYRRVADGVIVYSVGPDGIDNGGNLRNDRARDPGVDIGYRLWDVKYRRQPPKPPVGGHPGAIAPGEKPG
jgi:hypothetical protein